MPYHELAEKYGFTKRQLQYHLTRHCEELKPTETSQDLQKRLDQLVRQAELLVSGEDNASFSQKTKAITALNSVMKTALQTAGMLKSLAPAGQVSHDFTQSFEYRQLIAKINEAVVCKKCREKLLAVVHASS